jgi:hypothetical protein
MVFSCFHHRRADRLQILRIVIRPAQERFCKQTSILLIMANGFDICKVPGHRGVGIIPSARHARWMLDKLVPQNMHLIKFEGARAIESWTSVHMSRCSGRTRLTPAG